MDMRVGHSQSENFRVLYLFFAVQITPIHNYETIYHLGVLHRGTRQVMYACVRSKSARGSMERVVAMYSAHAGSPSDPARVPRHGHHTSRQLLCSALARGARH